MGQLKCCVGGCSSTSETNRLFCFPDNAKLCSLWLQFIVPTNPQLIGLSKNQLRSKRVCAKHFDEQQFDGFGKRLRYSYPCLMTDEELLHGVPLSTEGYNVMDEHNYCRILDEDDYNPDESSIVISRPGDDYYLEHLSCAHTVEDVAQNPGCKESRSFSLDENHKQNNEKPAEPSVNLDNQPSCSYSNPKPCCIKETAIKRKANTTKSLGSKKRRFMKEVKKIATESLGSNATQRLMQGQHLVRNTDLLNQFECLNKQAKTFLIMQLREARKHKMARRFTLDEKLIALTLLKQSPKGYKLLKNMFALPSKRTLTKLSEKISFEPGLNPQIFEQISKNTQRWDTRKKLCSIVFDEIALTPHLNFNEKNDIIEGFVDVNDERRMRMCDHALVFMIRGICAPWRQCAAYYFCEGTVSAAQLKNILEKIVAKVAETGLIPLALVCDQGSTFRTAIKNFRTETIRLRNDQGVQDDGTLLIAGYDLNIFYDPPHLLKGIRNNFLTKEIIWNGKTATWNDILFIFDIDSKLGHTRALPKLTQHHVDAKKMKKMKVSVAAQVLSSRTAAMLRYTDVVGHLHSDTPSTMTNTAEVVEFFDKLFDSVNGSPGSAIRGKLRNAVKPSSPHIAFWREAIKSLKEMKFRDASSKRAIQTGQPRLVRVPSLDGWITTLESFIRISKLLFNKYNVEYLYPRYINQDPLENFFGRIRAMNFRNTNPNASVFKYSCKSLVLSNILNPHSKYANCEEDDGETILNLNYLFDKKTDDKENISPNIASNQYPLNIESPSHVNLESNLKTQVLMEKVKVHCSAYTAGYVCRKLSKILKCKTCLKTYTSENILDIHKYIQHREYKSLKNNNLAYPSEQCLRSYRDGSQYIHSYLNKYASYRNIGSSIRKQLGNTLNLSWLGCTMHKDYINALFIKIIIRIQIHNWCNVMNRTMRGSVENKYIEKMSNAQKLAFKKYETFRLRKKSLNK